MMKHCLTLCIVALLLLTGCEKKLEPVAVGDMSDYKDPGYGFHIKYPKEWKQLGQTGKAVFVRSQEVANKFIDPRSGEEGAQVIVEVIKLDGKSADELIQSAKDEMKDIAQFGADAQLSVAGKPATKVPYTIPVTSKVNITGYDLYVRGDTALYKLEFAGYGDHFTAHAAVFEAMLASFTMPIIMTRQSDVWMPSPNLETFTSNFFTMQYPENLTFVETKKGDKDFVVEMRADRRDCSIHIDVFGAKGLTIDKVWEQNKGRYKGVRTNGETTIDGLKAYWVDYTPVANITSRAYFVVKNDKVIRSTINYFALQKDIYFPAFEKCVTSLKLK